MSTGTKRILLIDDEDGARQITRFGLESATHWQVLTAPSGVKGLARAKTEQPHAILLDMMMPAMDGMTVLEYLQQDPSTQGIPVILLTAKSIGLDQTTWKAMGVAGIITKPFKIRELVDSICSYLQWEN